MACALQWIPDSLYNYAIAVAVSNHSVYMKEFNVLHQNVLFDICYKMYKEGMLNELKILFSDITTFYRLLTVKDKQNLLHHCFQALVDHGTHIAEELACSYSCLVNMFSCDAKFEKNLNEEKRDNAINIGMVLGGFLNDAGWYIYADSVLSNCLMLCHTVNDKQRYLRLCVDCYQCLLYAKNEFCKFYEAEQTYKMALKFAEQIHSSEQEYNFAGLYKEFSNVFFSRCQYSEAYDWSMKAIAELKNCKLPKVIVAVLGQAAKACAMKRRFKQAEFLIEQAFYRASSYFGNRDPVMAHFLADYGFYLLNIDRLSHARVVCQAALEARQYIFGGTNLLVAFAHQDLAYIYYVYEYSIGRFTNAKEHIDKSFQMLTSLLPPNHFLLASAKRVKALIVEEIAVDTTDKITEKRLLLESLELHTAALRSAQEAFGEMSIYTAKHYGNLGRLYQSMRKFEDAKDMHLKAIRIKEQLLGPDDHELALSYSHLASLYNYDLCKFEQAEILYTRSVNIGKKTFGSAYSGLEYDYQGLMRVYTAQDNLNAARYFHDAYVNWKRLRQKVVEAENQTSPLAIDVTPVNLKDICFRVFAFL